MVHRMEEEENKKPESKSEHEMFSALQTTSLGPKILEAAIEKRKKEISDGIVRQADELLRLKAVSEEEIRKHQKIINDTDEKIDKLNTGQFTIGYGGSISYK